MATITGASFESTVNSIYSSAADEIVIKGFLDSAYYSKPELTLTVDAGAGKSLVQDLPTARDFILNSKDFTLGTGVEDGGLTGAAGAATKLDIFGRKVNDLSGNSLDNVLTGNDFNNQIGGLNGNDSIVGGGGKDTLNGNNGNDVINGGSGNDKINGGSGNDSITGGTGNDVMTGSSGNDVFTIGAGDGAFNDVITDFGSVQVNGVTTSSDSLVILGHDADLSGSFDRADFTIGDPAEGKGTLINFVDGGSVLLKNISLNDLVFDSTTGSFELFKDKNTTTQDGNNDGAAWASDTN